MPISFLTIPATIRTGGVFVEFSNALASQGLTPTMPNQLLLIGQNTSGGSTAQNVLTPVASRPDAEAKFGHGSVLAHMAEKLFANPLQAQNPVPVFAIGVNPDGAGAKAGGSFAFTGPATAAGSIFAYIGGERIVASVANGDSANTVATSLFNAINTYCAANNLPVVSTNGTPGTTTVTAIDKGTHGNQIDLRLNYNQGDILPAGLACTVTAMSGGTGTIDLTSAIAAIGDTWFNTIVVWLKDSTNIGRLETFLLGQWGPMVMKDGLCYFAGTGTKSNQESDTTGRNSPFSVYMGGGQSPTPAWVFATDAAMVDATEPDAGRPRGQVLMPNCLPPAPGLSFVWADRNTMLGEGISTYTVSSGQVFTERLITTYQKTPANVADTSYMRVETMRTLAFMRFTFRTKIQLKYFRYKLAADGTTFDPSQKIATPKTITATAVAWGQDMIDAGLMFDKAAFVQALQGQVQFNPSDPDRVDLVLTPQLIRQFNTLAGQISFLL